MYKSANNFSCIYRRANAKSFSTTKIVDAAANTKFKDTLRQTASTKSHVNVGTIGHIDHGKTTLSSAITKFLSLQGGARFRQYDEIDNAREEKTRGITINASRMSFETHNRHYAHTDCPGHQDFIKNMIMGASQMDIAILVIAADDGIMAQTREHLLLARDLGVKNVVIFVNKSDLVENDDLDLVELEASELLEALGFDPRNVPVIRGSALNALENDDFHAIKSLLEKLDAFADSDRKTDGPFIMPISSVQAIKGRGGVIIGTIESGVVRKGDQLELCGFDVRLNASVSDIHIFNRSYREVKAGDHCGILCKGEIKSSSNVRRGMWLTSPNSVKCTNFVRTQLFLLEEGISGRRLGIRPGFSDHVYCTTWNTAGRLHFRQEILMPGENVEAWLFFNRNVPILKRLPFTFREKRRTIARGIITEIYEPIDIADPSKCWKNFNSEEAIAKTHT